MDRKDRPSIQSYFREPRAKVYRSEIVGYGKVLNNRRPLVFYGRSGRETKKFVEWKLARVFDNNSELPVNRIKKKKKKKNRRSQKYSGLRNVIVHNPLVSE